MLRAVEPGRRPHHVPDRRPVGPRPRDRPPREGAGAVRPVPVGRGRLGPADPGGGGSERVLRPPDSPKLFLAPSEAYAGRPRPSARGRKPKRLRTPDGQARASWALPRLRRQSPIEACLRRPSSSSAQFRAQVLHSIIPSKSVDMSAFCREGARSVVPVPRDRFLRRKPANGPGPHATSAVVRVSRRSFRRVAAGVHRGSPVAVDVARSTAAGLAFEGGDRDGMSRCDPPHA